MNSVTNDSKYKKHLNYQLSTSSVVQLILKLHFNAKN